MNESNNVHSLTNKESVHFQFSQCGRCCRNVRDIVMLEALDAFRLVKHLQTSLPEKSPEELLCEYADLRLLSRGYFIYILKTANDSGVCVFLKENHCSIYSARPRVCRLYSFALEPTERGMQWHLCTEQPHHFKGGHTTAREWERKYLSEETQFLLTETRVLPQFGSLMERIPSKALPRAEALTLMYTYYAYDHGEPFLVQYQANMDTLKQRLERLIPKKERKNNISTV